MVGSVVLYLLQAEPPRVLPCVRGFLNSFTVFLLLNCKCTQKKIKSRRQQCFGKADKNGKPELFEILHLRFTNAYVRPSKNHEGHRFLKKFPKNTHTHTHTKQIIFNVCQSFVRLTNSPPFKEAEI